MSHQLIKMYQQVIDEDTDYQMENHSTANMNKSLKHDEIANSFNVLFGFFFLLTRFNKISIGPDIIALQCICNK